MGKQLVCINLLFSCVVLTALAAMPLRAQEAEKSTRDLAMFIGKWQFVDAATELAGFEYREEGITECSYALDDAYIRCDSTGTANGKTRTYVDYLNYNSITDTYERTGLFGNFPEKSSFTMTIREGGMVIEQMGAPVNQRNGTTSTNWGLIRFTDADNFTWETRLNRSHQPPDHWPLSFIGTYKRIE